MRRPALAWTLAALAGLVLVAGVTLAASRLSSQAVGLSSEAPDTGSTLAPPSAKETAAPTPTPTPRKRKRKPRRTPTATVTPRPVVTAAPPVVTAAPPAPVATQDDDGGGDDSSGKGRGRGRGGDDSSDD
jgi:septal ring-binding cell division protein DamX